MAVCVCALLMCMRATSHECTQPYFLYIDSITSLYFSATTDRLSFRVAVKSPPRTEKSLLSTLKYCTFCALLTHFPLLLYFVIPSWIASRTSCLFIASVTEILPKVSFAAPSSSSLCPPVSLSSTDLSVTSATLNFFLSPTIITFDMNGQLALMVSSMGMGAMFSPPAVMISSLIRPVMYTRPFSSICPTSPECSQPLSSIASLHLSSLLMYPCMM
mmetsp:Transcript_42352/g.83187  ORF Transcript_42352/g.83187 Transcript_42352/m.83187 type:complete len:216 (+) Transcript_42352:795-1442(+)